MPLVGKDISRHSLIPNACLLNPWISENPTTFAMAVSVSSRCLDLSIEVPK